MSTKPILFLDIDGVLNDRAAHPRTRYCSIDRDKALRLDRILVEADARIVLTSAWRYMVHGGSMTLDGLRNLLYSHWIDGSRLIGITRRDRWELNRDDLPLAEIIGMADRGPQISKWISEKRHTGPFVVIDDKDLGINREGHPFVQTDGKIGLTDEDVDLALELIAMQTTVSTEDAPRARP